MKNIVSIILSATLFFVPFTGVSAAGNPGESAMGCLSISTEFVYSGAMEVKFKNNCSYRIFVVYCGEPTYSKKRCGQKSFYYSYSGNIDSGETHSSVAMKNGSSYEYAACKGGISFGTDGIEAPSSDDGDFRCTET